MLVWSLPFIGPIGRDLDVGQSCEVMAILLENGRTLEQALLFASNVSGPALSGAYISVIRAIAGRTGGERRFCRRDAHPPGCKTPCLAWRAIQRFSHSHETGWPYLPNTSDEPD